MDWFSDYQELALKRKRCELHQDPEAREKTTENWEHRGAFYVTTVGSPLENSKGVIYATCSGLFSALSVSN